MGVLRRLLAQRNTTGAMVSASPVVPGVRGGRRRCEAAIRAAFASGVASEGTFRGRSRPRREEPPMSSGCLSQGRQASRFAVRRVRLRVSRRERIETAARLSALLGCKMRAV